MKWFGVIWIRERCYWTDLGGLYDITYKTACGHKFTREPGDPAPHSCMHCNRKINYVER